MTTEAFYGLTLGHHRVGSLFSGIGGLDLGFVAAGFEIAWTCEIDPFCRAVLEERWPGVPCYEDVKTLANAAELRQGKGLEQRTRTDTPGLCGTARNGASPPEIDVLIGGFPCQDVSLAGSGAGLAGHRSGLWFEFARLIGALRPRVVVVENVPGLFVRGIDQVLGRLATLGYDAEWSTLSASEVGAPHLRERVFIVAYPGRFSGSGRGEAGDVASQTGDTESPGPQRERVRDAASHGRQALGHADGGGCERRGKRELGRQQGSPGGEPDGPDSGRAGVTDMADASIGRLGIDGSPRGSGGHPDECGSPLANGAVPRRPERVSQPRLPGSPERGIAGAIALVVGHQWPAGRGEAQYPGEPRRVLPSSRAQPGLGRMVDGIPAGMDPHFNRRARLAALGNSVLPQVAYVVAQRAREVLEAQDAKNTTKGMMR